MSLRIAVLNGNAGQLALLTGALAAYRCLGFHTLSELQHRSERAGAAGWADWTDLLLLDWSAINTQTNTQTGPASAATALLTSARAADVPVLLSVGLSELASPAALDAALLAGAADYLVKPLRSNEILLRVQVLAERAYPQHPHQQQIRFANYVFETPSNRITHGGVTVEMTQKEFELALLLFGNLGRPLSRAYIQDAIWSRDSDLPSRTMDTHISRVRNKLSLKPENGYRLTPVYGYGYQLEQTGAK